MSDAHAYALSCTCDSAQRACFLCLLPIFFSCAASFILRACVTVQISSSSLTQCSHLHKCIARFTTEYRQSSLRCTQRCNSGERDKYAPSCQQFLIQSVGTSNTCAATICTVFASAILLRFPVRQLPVIRRSDCSGNRDSSKY